MVLFDNDVDFSKIQDRKKSREFKNWFEGSKVAHPNGEPMTVYHGTTANFDKFRISKGQHRPKGLYFTPDPEVASGMMRQLWKDDPDSYSDGSNVFPVYVALKNPLTLDGLNYDPLQENAWIKHAKDLGHDGLILNREGGTNYVAFHPHQIKSAIANQGTYSPKESNILFDNEQLDLGSHFIDFSKGSVSSDPHIARLRSLISSALLNPSHPFGKIAHKDIPHWVNEIKGAFDPMSTEAVRRAAQNIDAFHIYPSGKHLTEHLISYEGHPKFREWNRAFMGNYLGSFGSAREKLGDEAKALRLGVPDRKVLRHELFHAIDADRSLMSSPKWKNIFEKDIKPYKSSRLFGLRKTPPLSEYAQTNEHEGGAEAFRIMHEIGPDAFKKAHPRVHDFFEDEGLVPTQSDTTRKEPLVELFTHSLSDNGGKIHADASTIPSPSRLKKGKVDFNNEEEESEQLLNSRRAQHLTDRALQLQGLPKIKPDAHPTKYAVAQNLWGDATDSLSQAEKENPADAYEAHVNAMNGHDYLLTGLEDAYKEGTALKWQPSYMKILKAQMLSHQEAIHAHQLAARSHDDTNQWSSPLTGIQKTAFEKQYPLDRFKGGMPVVQLNPLAPNHVGYSSFSTDPESISIVSLFADFADESKALVPAKTLTPLGLYSNVEEAVKQWKPKGSPHELRKHLAKTAGTGYSDKLEYEMEPHPQYGQMDEKGKPYPKERHKQFDVEELDSPQGHWWAGNSQGGKKFPSEKEAREYASITKVPLPWKELQGATPKEKTWLVPGNQADHLKLEELLKGKKHVTKEEVLAHIKKHDVPFSEVDQNKLLGDVSDLEKKAGQLHSTPDEELEPIKGQSKWKIIHDNGDTEEGFEDEHEAQNRADLRNDEHYTSYLSHLEDEWAPEQNGEGGWDVNTEEMPERVRLAWEARGAQGLGFPNRRAAVFALGHFLQYGAHDLQQEDEANPWSLFEDADASGDITDPAEIRAHRLQEIQDEIDARREKTSSKGEGGAKYKEHSMPNETGMVPSTYNELHVTAPNQVDPEETDIEKIESIISQLGDDLEDKDPSHYRLYAPGLGRQPSIVHLQTGVQHQPTGWERIGGKELTWHDQHSDYGHVENPMARLRYDIRQDPEGKKNFFMQEIQAPGPTIQRGMPEHVSKRLYQTGLKRALTKAVEEGADKFSWTTGDQQRERYNLRNKVDRLTWMPSPNNPEEGQLTGIKGGQEVFSERIRSNGPNLAEYVGPELAKSLQTKERKHPWSVRPSSQEAIAQGFSPWGIYAEDGGEIAHFSSEEGAKESLKDNYESKRPPAIVEGKGLEVGGMGHRRNYDKMIPNMLQDIVKKAAAEHKINVPKEQLSRTKTPFNIKARDIGIDVDANGGHDVYVKYGDPSSTLHRRILKEGLTAKEAMEYQDELKAKKIVVPEEVHTLVLTPEIKAAIAGGLPSFSISELMKEAGVVDFDQKSTDKRIRTLKHEFEGMDTLTELRRDLIRELRSASEQALIEVLGSDAPRDAKALVRDFLREQKKYAYNYAAEAKDSGVQPHRTQLYASALHGIYQSLKRLKAEKNGAQWERRVLGPSETSCSTCKGLAKQGWAPVGSLPKIGESPCKVNCRCRFEFSVQNEKPR